MATHLDLAIYYHRADFFPVTSTFITAINNRNLSTWPGLTSELIFNNPPKSLATEKGHAKLAQKNVRSTRLSDPTPDLPVNSVPPPTPDTRTKNIRITVIEPGDLLAT